MSLLDDVSIVVTPNAYKAGTLYSVLPTAIAGSEIVTNGDFSNGTTGWSSPDYNSTLSIVGGQMKIVNTITLGRVVQAITTVVGKTYLASGTITNIDNSTGIQLKLSNGANLDGAFFDSAFNTTTNPVTITRAFEATATTTYIGSSQGSVVGQSALLDNVSVKEWTGADMDVTRETAATRVDEDGLVNYAEILGDEDVVNGDFSDGLTGWVGNPETTLSVSNNELDIQSSSAGGEYGAAFSEVNFELGKQYIVQLTVVSCDVPNHIRVGGRTSATGYAGNIWGSGDIGIGTHSKVYTPTQNYTYLSIGGRNDVTTLVIDNVSVKEVTRDNVPRIDYTGGGCPHVLAEPQRTNLVPESEDFDSYRVAGSTATPNSTTAPDGTNSGILVTQGTNTLVLRVSNVVAPSTTYTFSGYFKSSSSITQVILDITDNGNTTFDLTNEWQRFSVTAESRAGGSPYHFVDVATNGSQGDTFYAWGLQVEEGSYATSYIPTSGGTVTRNQDQFTRDGIGSLINSTEGTLFLELAANNVATFKNISINSDGSNRVNFFIYISSVTVNFDVGGVTQASLSYSIPDVTSFNKFAFTYKLNEFKLFVNGTQRATDTSGIVPSANTFDTVSFNDSFGNNFFGKVKQLQVYKTALTDEQLLQLTGESGTDFYESYAEMAAALTYTLQ